MMDNSGTQAWCRITFAAVDFERFESIMDTLRPPAEWQIDMEENRQIIVSIFSAEDGGAGVTDKLENAGFTFSAKYGRTEGFDGGAIACFLGNSIEVKTNYYDFPVVEMTPPDKIDSGQLDDIKCYYHILTRIEDYISAGMRAYA